MFRKIKSHMVILSGQIEIKPLVFVGRVHRALLTFSVTLLIVNFSLGTTDFFLNLVKSYSLIHHFSVDSNIRVF